MYTYTLGLKTIANNDRWYATEVGKLSAVTTGFY